jgi:hypothetical protein
MTEHTINTVLPTKIHDFVKKKVWVRDTMIPIGQGYPDVEPGDTIAHENVTFRHLLASEVDIVPGQLIIGVLNDCTGEYDIIYPQGGSGEKAKIVQVKDGGLFPNQAQRQAYFSIECEIAMLDGNPLEATFERQRFTVTPKDPQVDLYVLNYRQNKVLEDTYWVIYKVGGFWVLNNQATWMEDL